MRYNGNPSANFETIRNCCCQSRHAPSGADFVLFGTLDLDWVIIPTVQIPVELALYRP
jgi:hypothetical protein